MSHEEADPSFDMDPERPFPVEKYGSGEPQGQPSADLAAALGVNQDQQKPSADKPADPKPTEPASPHVDDPNAKPLIDKYSGQIQSLAEETYALALQKAKLDPDYLATLADSKDKHERRLAEKILSRNAEFGAATLDDFKAARAKQQAGDDPAAQALAEVKARQDTFDAKQRESEWKDFKDDNSITGDFAKVCDDLKAEHPDLPHGKLVAMAKGLMGAVPSASRKPGASGATGGAGAPQEDDPTSSPLAKSLLRGKATDTKQFAADYLGGKIL